MRRLLAIILLLPTLAMAGEIISTNSGTSGFWTNAAVWANGIVPNSTTNSAVFNVSAIITNNSGVTVSNYTQSAGTLTAASARNMSVGGTLTLTGGYFSIPSGGGLNSIPTRVLVNGGTFSSITLYVNVSGNYDITGFFTNAFITSMQFNVSGGAVPTYSVAPCTNTGVAAIVVGRPTLITLTNVYSAVGLNIFHNGGQVAGDNTLLSGCGGSFSFQQNSGGGTNYVENSDIYLTSFNGQSGTTAVTLWTNSTVRLAGTVTLNSSNIVTATKLVVANSSTLNANGATFDALTVSNTLRLANSVSVGGSLTNVSSFLPLGYAVTGGNLYNSGTLTASNSTVTVTNIVQSGGLFVAGTSSVRLAGNSNLTNYYGLSIIGSASGTNANVTANSIISESIANGFDGKGGTLTVATDSVFTAPISNLNVITNSHPVTVLRGGTNTTGNIRLFPVVLP
jgi:hypothetical protein